ncbi:MAG: CoA pyrophosphatase [Ignavibacteria bacterium]|nr:CoA pyrophosphatase [Ignavibacteria bacterium]
MDFYTWLERRLQAPLPGATAHRELIPNLPDVEARLKGAPPTARHSAVLIPLVQTENQFPDVMFTLRSERMRSHRGQISFPGGRCDEGEDAITTALRELHEETGVANSGVHVLGTMSSIFIPPSNSAVTPILAKISPQEYVTSELEVREIFHIPLEFFLKPESLEYQNKELFGGMALVPLWNVHKDVPLWGATAMMLNELVVLAREFRIQN